MHLGCGSSLEALDKVDREHAQLDLARHEVAMPPVLLTEDPYFRQRLALPLRAKMSKGGPGG